VRALSDCRLYGFVDLNYVGASGVERVAQSMIDGGVDIIQLRAKKSSIADIVDLAGKLHALTSAAGIPLIVNDYIEVAAQVPVDGVHLGQDDDGIADARGRIGRKILVGKSTHSLEQAVAAQKEGADYIGFGPIFATPTKPDYKPIGLDEVKAAHAQVQLPIFCIGGIKIDNLGEVLAARAKRVAIVSGLLKAQDIAKYARACKALLHPET
jgi:thiamine-phosphate pyrophosphorylase